MKRVLALLVTALLGGASTASADVRLSIHDGRVTIVARNATLRQILAEWARVGHTTIVNAERVPGESISLELNDVPEPQALEVLLRALSGYAATARATAVANLSLFDVVIVMPTTAARSAPPSPSVRVPAPFAARETGEQPGQALEVDAQEERGPAVNTPAARISNAPIGPTAITPTGPLPGSDSPRGQAQRPSQPAADTAAKTPGAATSPGVATGSSPVGAVSTPGVAAPPPPPPPPPQRSASLPGQSREPGNQGR